MNFTSDPATTANRVEMLRRYMAGNVLDPTGRCVCRNLGGCRRSTLFTREGARRSEAVFAEAQLSHVGRHYDLAYNGKSWRILVVAIETGRPRAGVTLDERRAEVLESAALRFGNRNPHMKGVTSALRLAVGRAPGDDLGGEFLRMRDGRAYVHLFDAYAMANLRLCSVIAGNAGKSLGNATMDRNCLPHLAATVKTLRPTFCIVQGAGLYRALDPLMANRRPLGPHLEQVEVAGVNMLVAALTHPSARGIHRWGALTGVPYLYETVTPTIAAAHRLLVEGRGLGRQ
ncbi:hypothetical protein [Plantactinospora sp. BB1]|uniref:hypothetical protein n=1 Tax=Plantactinospora sp. BB1 TaxID=2071627 RepID=UPI000D164D97|nr:hypothetical protein [Plantactinospora sp. BB1]AVT35375.1 hypothetical protein C6W10_01640 [Plantactinospora sp. BB1]